MKSSEPNLLFLIPLFGKDLSKENLTLLCSQLDDVTRNFIIDVYEKHKDIVSCIPQHEYLQLANAYEKKLLPLLKHEKPPLGLHLRQYVYYLRCLHKHNGDAVINQPPDFIFDMFRAAIIIEKSAKEI